MQEPPWLSRTEEVMDTDQCQGLDFKVSSDSFHFHKRFVLMA